MILLSVAFAVLAVKGTQTYKVKLQKSAKVIVIHQSHIFAFLSFLPVFITSALRYQVGVDYMSYRWLFELVAQGRDIHAEKGYRLLNEAVRLYTHEPQWIFVITALISLGLLFWGIYKYSPSPAMSIFLLVTMGYLFSSFNILRQYIAIALIFVALKLIKENRFLPFVFVVLAAMLFHKTAIIMIPMFFLVRLRLKQSYMFMIALVGMGCIPLRGVLTNILVNTFYPQYAGTDLIQPLSAFEFVYYVGIFGLLVLMCFAYKAEFFKDTYNLIVFNSVFYSLLIYGCLSFVPEINRIAVYIEIFVILLIPRLLQAEKNQKTRRLYTIGIVLLFSVFFIVSVGIMGRYGVLPYQTVFSQ